MSNDHAAAPLILDDPAVPSADVLGEGAVAVITAALAAAGAEPERIRPAQTTYYPGRSLSVRHEVAVRWADGTRTAESIVVAAGRKPPGPAFTVSDGSHDLVLWRVPHDPWLPGLAPALDPVRVGNLLTELGFAADGVRCLLRAYRPGRRAVIEVVGPGVRVFLKVVPTRSVERLHRRHEALASQLPVPPSLGWSAELGIVVLPALPGRTLRDALFGGFGLPGPDTLLHLLDHLPPAGGEAAPVDWRAHEFADLVGRVVPDLAERTARLADGLAPFEAEAAAHPVVATHGDFYEAQLLVDGGRVTGLLDIDTFGPGRRVDDLATMIGHLAVLAVGVPQRAAIERFGARLLAGFDHTTDPAVLRAAVAGVILGLATGPFRVLDPHWQHHTRVRVSMAENWLRSAHRVAAAA